MILTINFEKFVRVYLKPDIVCPSFYAFLQTETEINANLTRVKD